MVDHETRGRHHQRGRTRLGAPRSPVGEPECRFRGRSAPAETALAPNGPSPTEREGEKKKRRERRERRENREVPGERDDRRPGDKSHPSEVPAQPTTERSARAVRLVRPALSRPLRDGPEGRPGEEGRQRATRGHRRGARSRLGHPRPGTPRPTRFIARRPPSPRPRPRFVFAAWKGHQGAKGRSPMTPTSSRGARLRRCAGSAEPGSLGTRISTRPGAPVRPGSDIGSSRR